MRRSPDLRIALAFSLFALTAQAPAPPAQKQDEHSGVISFLVAADIRQTADGNSGLTELIDHAAALKNKPAFIVALGDVTNSGLSAEYGALDAGMKHAKETGITVYALPGSRDVSGLAEGKERFLDAFGKMYQSFDLNSAHFILLDSTVALHGLGHLDKIELEWLDRDLKRTRQEAPIFVFVYHSVGQQSPADRPLDNDYDLLSRLKGRNVAAVFCGDAGNNATWNTNGITMFTEKSASAGSVYHVALSQLLVSVDRENLSAPGKPEHVTNLPTGTKKGSIMRVVWDDPDNPYLERRRPAATLSPRAVADNPDKERAMYRVDSGPWKPLIKDRRDIWSETFATKDIAVGIHTADVLLTTSNDQRDVEELIFEVERDNREATRKWAIDLPASIQTSPLLSGDTLYVTCNDGKLYALNVKNGKRRWLFATKAAIVASPILSHDILYFGSTDKTFYAVEASSGRIKWHVDTESPILASAACARGVVCFGTMGMIYGLDMDTGTKRWGQPAEGPFESAAATDGDAFYLGDLSSTCWALDAATGNERWHVKLGAGQRQSPGISSPCILNGRVYYAAGDGMLHCLDAALGSEKWAKQAPVGEDPILTGSPVVCAGNIIVCGRGKLGTVYSFDAASGDLQWHTDIGQGIEATGVQPAPNGLSLALMGVRGRVAVLNAAKGTPLWGYELGPGNIFSTPAYDGSLMYSATMADDVQAINGPGVGK